MKNLLVTVLFLFNSFLFFAQSNTTHVYVFIAEECPISIYMVKPLKEVVNLDLDQVKYYAVFPKINSTQASAQTFLDQYELTGFEIILDPQQQLCKSMEATITPEVVITNDEEDILYRGRISDAYRAPGKMKHGLRKNDLKTVLSSILAGQTVSQPWPHAVGCFITFHH